MGMLLGGCKAATRARKTQESDIKEEHLFNHPRQSKLERANQRKVAVGLTWPLAEEVDVGRKQAWESVREKLKNVYFWHSNNTTPSTFLSAHPSRHPLDFERATPFSLLRS